ncbi:hypothetical protein DPMN_086551 [Dreissena polymorpha]|uniref:Uncharacterized protein n=1 Tax=Dreissena polymorpha TaxID=45954 RepID=A0A9D4KRP5_DREPO|nr:hypothetical protein DPMN_086551 [Dreissena polymorpha]
MITFPPPGCHFHEDRKINAAFRVKHAPPPGGHGKRSRPLGGHVFQATGTILELIHDIIGENLLTKLRDYRAINVVSRVLIRFYLSHIIKMPPPPSGVHVFQPTVTIFELVQEIIGTNLLNEFHEDRIINVTFRVLTRQMLTPHDAQRTTDKKRSQS